jgi:IMP dehydrogenase
MIHIITNMNQEISLGLSYNDVLLIPQYSDIESRLDVDLSTQITPHVKLKIPLISSNMSSVTNEKLAIELGILGGLGVIPRFMPSEEEADIVAKVKQNNVLVGAAVGEREDPIERAEMLVKAGADVLFLDVAHGYMEKTLRTTRRLKEYFDGKVDIVSGNVATYEAAEALFKNGADSVKVGVGPGTTCITRIQTGCGVPQITAVMESFRAAKKYKKTLICDGGMENSGDVVKGLAAGASAIMSGNLFAGANEAAGEILEKDGKLYKQYNGSTSLAEKMRQIEKMKGTLPANYIKQVEGVETLVPLEGSIADIVGKLTSNIRSGFSYLGARNIKKLWESAHFIRVSPMGFKENGAHNVIVK